MNRPTLFSSLFAALALVSAFPAHAELKIGCPVRWEMLAQLDGRNLDTELFGVKVRDWKPEFLDQVMRRQDECHAKSGYPESLKKAERDDSRRLYQVALAALEERDRRLNEEVRGNQMRTAISESKLTGIKIDSRGLPESVEVAYSPTNRANVMCRDLSRGIGYAPVESFRQVAAFARLCQQTQQTDANTVATLERQANGIAALYQAIDAFIPQVQEAAKRASIPESRVKELSAAQLRIQTQIESLRLPDYRAIDSTFGDALSKLKTMQEQVNEKACMETFAKTNLPPAWKNYLIVYEWNNPRRLLDVVCYGIRHGAQIKYLSGGLFGSEGIEVKSINRTLQLFTQTNRIPGGDPNVQALSLVAAKIGGQKFNVGHANLQAVAAELGAAIQNQ